MSKTVSETNRVAQCSCANCGKVIAAGKEKRYKGKPYGPKCFQMVTGEIPNSKLHPIEDGAQEVMPELDSE